MNSSRMLQLNELRKFATREGHRKTAGTGWDLHGYHRDPDVPDASDADAKQKAYLTEMRTQIGEYPILERKKRGLLGRLWHGNRHVPTTPEQKAEFEKTLAAYRDKHKAYTAVKGPIPTDSWDYRSSSRIKLPREHKTNYKLNANIDAHSGFGLSPFATDPDAKDKPARNLSKADLAAVLKKYQAAAKSYAAQSPDDPWVAPGTLAFTEKAKALLKNPKTRFARLEWE